MLSPQVKRKEYCLVMSRGDCLRAVVVMTVLAGLQSCDFYHGKDFVKGGTSQSDLRSLLRQHASIELTEHEKVVNAYSNGGRDPTLWFEVSFDSSRAENLQEMLLRNGYAIRVERPEIMPRVTPANIIRWWDPSAMDSSTLFTLQRDKEHPDTNGVWCFLDGTSGKLIGSCFTY